MYNYGFGFGWNGNGFGVSFGGSNFFGARSAWSNWNLGGENNTNFFAKGAEWTGNYQRGADFANNSIWGGGFGDIQYGASFSNNRLKGLGGSDRQIAGYGSNNLMNGGFGNDYQQGAEASNNIFKPGKGNNTLVTVGENSKNHIDLSSGNNRYGHGNIFAAAGQTTLDATDYRGPGYKIKLNDNDTVRFNPYKGINENIKIKGNPQYQPIFS